VHLERIEIIGTQPSSRVQ